MHLALGADRGQGSQGQAGEETQLLAARHEPMVDGVEGGLERSTAGKSSAAAAAASLSNLEAGPGGGAGPGVGFGADARGKAAQAKRNGSPGGASLPRRRTP